MTYQKTKNNQPLKIAVGTDNFKEMISDYDVVTPHAIWHHLSHFECVL